MNSKNAKIALIAIAIVLAGVVIYFAFRKQPEAITQTTPVDETADWKTYSNSEYGFSFKYPNDWEVRDLTVANKKIDSSLNLFVGAGPKNIKEDVSYTININSGSLDNIVNKYNQVIDNSEMISNKTMEKYGETVKAITKKNKSNNLEYTSYYIEKDNNVHIITGPQEGNNNGRASTINKMVETFQFTE